jgi:hypothetical protein
MKALLCMFGLHGTPHMSGFSAAHTAFVSMDYVPSTDLEKMLPSLTPTAGKAINKRIYRGPLPQNTFIFVDSS